MTKNEVVTHMVAFVEEKEREAQANKLLNDNQVKSDIVNSILDELERVVNHEN